MATYHEEAQKFIKGSKARGYNVTAEGSELIAHPPGTPGYVKPVVKDPIKKGGPLDQKANIEAAYKKAVDSNKSGVGFGGEKPTVKRRSTSSGYMPR